jgi:hypothetical protein
MKGIYILINNNSLINSELLYRNLKKEPAMIQHSSFIRIAVIALVIIPVYATWGLAQNLPQDNTNGVKELNINHSQTMVTSDKNLAYFDPEFREHEKFTAAGVFAGRVQEVIPTHSIVRFFKCSPTGTAIEWLQRWRPFVQEMIEEGKFVDYGILRHAWGDEWNVVDYFVVADLGSFFPNFDELIRRVLDSDKRTEWEEEELPSFSEVCTQHKDIIYAIVPPAFE